MNFSFSLAFPCFNHLHQIFDFFFFTKNEEEKKNCWKYSLLSTVEIGNTALDLEIEHYLKSMEGHGIHVFARPYLNNSCSSFYLPQTYQTCLAHEAGLSQASHV